MLRNFFKFIGKLFMGQYDEMGWEDLFHGLIFIGLSCGLMYALT